MVIVDLDSSAILVKPIKDRSSEELKRAYLHLLRRMKAAGMHPKKHTMDNEVSELLRYTIQDKCKLELVTKGFHQQNVAEVAIKTFKEHFIAILAGLPDSFPVQLWCDLLPQEELTLDVLWPSCAGQEVSAHAYLFRPGDIGRLPLALIG